MKKMVLEKLVELAEDRAEFSALAEERLKTIADLKMEINVRKNGWDAERGKLQVVRGHVAVCHQVLSILIDIMDSRPPVSLSRAQLLNYNKAMAEAKKIVEMGETI